MDESIRQREFTRNPVRLPATVTFEGGHVVTGQTRELSMNGLFVECDPADTAIDTPCRVKLTLPDGSTELEMEARLANRLSSGLGIAFTGIDTDSFAHLKRLILFNASDYQRVSDEIEHHAGFKTRIGDTED